MPLSYDAFPLAGNALAIARGDHEVTATGPCCILHRMIPSPQGVVQANGDVRFSQWRIFFLGLPVLRPGNLPPNALLANFTIGVNRIGIALDIVLVVPTLDTSPCSPAVARRRITAVATTAYTANPLPFLVMAADLLPTEQAPPPPPPPAAGGPVVAVRLLPCVANIATM